MKVKIYRIDKALPLPKYHSPGAVAFDLSARTATTIKPGTMARIPTNIIIEVPVGYMLLVKDRSSTLKRKGLLTTVGYIDQDYSGPDDELMLQVYNPGDKTVEVEIGDRLGQAAFIRIEKPEWEEVNRPINSESRGGFGSTGNKT